LLLGGRDVEGLTEIFERRTYEPVLPLPPRPRILDLGANVGLFTAWALQEWPQARVTAFEPDPENMRVLRRFVATNGLEHQVKLVEAAVGSQDGTVNFKAGLGSGSALSDDGALTVPKQDAQPLMAEADLVKIDIEGGEWELLRDPRLHNVRAQIVLEYHRYLCPGRGDPLRPDPRPRHLAHETLREAGFSIRDVEQRWWGHGTLVGWRS